MDMGRGDELPAQRQRPDAPWITLGQTSGLINLSNRPRFLLPTSTGTLPATVEIRGISISGDRKASIKASASSTPGSVSMTICRGVALPEFVLLDIV